LRGICVMFAGVAAFVRLICGFVTTV